MNKLSVTGPVWLASDIHLGQDNPRTAEAFFRFLDQAGAHAGALFLLGDIFNVWIGDDWADDPPPWLAEVVTELTKTAQKVPTWLGHGNRDFLMGNQLTDRIGAKLLDDQVVLQTHEQSILLAHGDEFCTTDKAYQRFRRIVRNPWIQALYLSLGLKQRLAIAQRARHKSQQSQSHSTAMWHDVSLADIDSTLRQTPTRTLIHGHTHRPGHFVDHINGQPIDRWVLSDWEMDHLEAGEPGRAGWLIIDEGGIRCATFDQ